MTKPLRCLLFSLSLIFQFTNSLLAQNTCATATTITTGSCTAGTVVGSTADAIAACSGTVKYDLWYKFVATSTNPTISLTNIGTNFLNQSPKLQLFSGTACGSLTSITCSGSALTGTALTVGGTYYVRVYSTTSSAIPTSAGNFDICISDPGAILSSRMNEVFFLNPISGTNAIDDPWEIIYGPDNYLWITEAKGYHVYRMDPNTGARTTILDLTNSASGYLSSTEHTAYNRAFNIGTNNPQGGLAGMVLHPDWANKKFVYLSYVHSYNSTAANSAGVFFTNRVVRFTYNTTTNKLESPITICDTIPGSGDHNSQRLAIAPVGGTDYLFYAAGDMGAGQFGNARRLNKAQIVGAYEGKILRFNLDTVGTGSLFDKWIPSDNPYNVSLGQRSAVWCIGIRNNQGFAYANGKLYGSSHGPYSDDELNILDSNKNYGHPIVIGKADGNYNNSKAGHKNGTDATLLPLITDEVATAASLTNYRDPLFSAYVSDQATVYDIWSKADDANSSNDIGNGLWPSEGWSGMDAYNSTYIPGWKNSLLIGSLKWGRVLRFKLDGTGSAIQPINGFDTLSYFGSKNRFRDMAISPNGKDIYVIMDKSETTSGPSAANPRVAACNGCVQKYTFLGYYDNAGESSIPTAIPVTPGGTNSCRTGTTVTIDASNNSIWVPITGPDGNVIAEINANGQNLGAVQSSFYTTSTIRTTGGRKFLGRNIYLDPAIDPASNVKIRLYITKTELDALITAGGTTGVGNLQFLRNTDVCRSFPVTAATMIAPTVAKLHGTDAYVLQATMALDAANSFYFASGNFVLPVQKLTFTGALQNNITQLKWSTEHENNTAHFVVERSTNANDYYEIGTVQAKGNSAAVENYNLTDGDVVNLDAKVVYYRLKIVDANNEWKYSDVVAIKVSNINEIVSVSPNPVDHIAQVSISPTATGTIKWSLTDNNGRTIIEGKVSVQKNKTQRFNINMYKFAQGTYFLQLSGAASDAKIKVQKL